jgi:hypothetical protein
MTKRAKNKKKNSVNMKYPGPMLPLLSLVVCLGLAYLWICGRCDALGMEISNLEQQREELQRRVNHEQMKWELLSNLQGVRDALERFGLTMELAPHDRVVYLAREDLSRPHEIAGRETRYAQLNDRSNE